MACYNRREQTLACLKSLYAQQLPKDTALAVYLTDDHSTDGTADAIHERYPDVEILNGSGNLFWVGGMRNSWNAALAGNYDAYLLLNDDTVLVPKALKTLIALVQPQNCIGIGTTWDKARQAPSYGGRRLWSRRSDKSRIVYDENVPVECDMANANIMLVPKAVVAQIGILSAQYTQSMADYDYVLRAKRAGFRAVVAPGILGHCTDDHGNNWRSVNVPLKQRIAYLKSPKGLSYNEYLGFIRQHFPFYLPEVFVKLWLKTLFPVLWDKFKVKSLQH